MCQHLHHKLLVLLLINLQQDYAHVSIAYLKKLEYPNYDIIVVDNASSDGSVSYLKDKYPAHGVAKSNPIKHGAATPM